MDRRDMLKLGAAALAGSVPAPLLTAEGGVAAARTVEQWGVFELELKGPSAGNPFEEVTLGAAFSQGHRNVEVKGFYDGEGVYRVRFMPDTVGVWRYMTSSGAAELAGKSGQFECTPAQAGNHGPVTTARRFHFAHADGVPYFPFGTTTYAFFFTSEENAAQAVGGMKDVFNKTRACVLPKPLGDVKEPVLPFPRTGETNDYARFNPEYFRLLERRVLALQAAGVEADCILFHPYDAWGYKAMPNAACEFYLRYVVARLAAYRNVWWSIANEYDLVKSKVMSDWDRFFQIVQTEDPYGHLRSVHHSVVMYDHSRPWCTHASLQSYDFEKSEERRAAWNKPIVYDEIQYEGDIERRWGNLAAEEMTRRFWLATVRGAYASHGEVFGPKEGEMHPAMSADAGKLRGASPARIGFLRGLVERFTQTGFNESVNGYYLNASDAAGNYIWYFDYHRPAQYEFPLPNTGVFEAVMVDPFAMTETKLAGTFTGKSRIRLADRAFQAVMFRRIADAKAG